MSFSKKIIKFNSNTIARDKFYRTFQYGSRLLAWYLETEEKNELIVRLRRLEAALSLSRKLFRMGNSMDLIHKTVDSMSILDQQLMVLSVAGNSFKSIWLIMDHLLWFSKVGLIQLNQGWWTRWSSRAWLVALIASVLADLRKLNIVKLKMENESKQKRTHEAGQVSAGLQTELHNAQLTFYKDFFDMFIPLSGLGYLELGVGAVCGVVSSLIGFQQEWEKHVTPFKPT